MPLDTLRGRFRRRYAEAPPPGTTHILQYLPPAVFAPPRPAGAWVLQTLFNHENGTPDGALPDVDGGLRMAPAKLSRFTEDALGWPVALTPFREEILLDSDPGAGWLPAPGYYLTPARGHR